MRTGDGVEFDVGGIDVAISVEVSRSVVVRAGAVAVVVAVIIDVTNSVDIGVCAVTTAVTIIVLKAAEEEEESISAVNCESTEKIKKFECYWVFWF